MSSKHTELFVSDAGTEVSVRTSRDVATDALLIEPLYATDIEVLDGATGELRAGGTTLRGTLRRESGRFVLASEHPRTSLPARRKAPPPPAVPVFPAVAPPSTPAVRRRLAAQPQPMDAEVLEATETLSRFVRDDSGVLLTAARRAHAVLGRFIAKRERQARARK